jgi:hypothetical protein
MVFRYERPSIGFEPQIYTTFIVKNKETNEEEEFIIQDLPKDRVEDGARFMIEFYTKDEIFQRSFKVSEVILMNFYRFILTQKVSLVCFKKGSNKILGLNALTVKSKDVDTNFKVTILKIYFLCDLNIFFKSLV